MSKVSIIIPVYNVENLLNECLESIRHQTFSDIEIILVNDGSTDNSENICDMHAEIDKRIKVIHIANSGVSVARNIGLQHAKSKYVAFVDSDDYVDIGLIEELYKKATLEDADFVMCGYEKIFYKDDKISNSISITPIEFDGEIRDFLNVIEGYIENPLLQGPCWKLFRRKIIIDNRIIFPEDMSFGEDAAFVYEFLKFASKINIIEKAMYFYRVHNASSLSRTFRSDKYEINLYLVELLKELFYAHGVNSKVDFISKQITGSYISYLGEIWRLKEPLHKDVRNNIISNASNNKKTKDAFINQKKVSVQNRILEKLILKEDIRFIDYYFYSKEKIRVNMSSVYNFLTRLKR